jgi:hypothetical protein
MRWEVKQSTVVEEVPPSEVAEEGMESVQWAPSEVVLLRRREQVLVVVVLEMVLVGPHDQEFQQLWRRR